MKVLFVQAVFVDRGGRELVCPGLAPGRSGAKVWCTGAGIDQLLKVVTDEENSQAFVAGAKLRERPGLPQRQISH